MTATFSSTKVPAAKSTDDEVTLQELLETPELRKVTVRFLCLLRKVLDEQPDDGLAELDFAVHKIYRAISVEERKTAWATD